MEERGLEKEVSAVRLVGAIVPFLTNMYLFRDHPIRLIRENSQYIDS